MTRLIKKYKNRRLYDTEKSRYITIDDLQHYVLEGTAFRVVDSSSEKDLTNATLLQILAEMEAGATRFLSSDMLKQLIILAHHPMNESLQATFDKMIDFMQSQAQASPYLDEYKKTGDALNKQMQTFYAQWENLFKK